MIQILTFYRTNFLILVFSVFIANVISAQSKIVKSLPENKLLVTETNQIDPSTLSKSPLVKIENSVETNQIDPSTLSKSPLVKIENLVETEQIDPSTLSKSPLVKIENSVETNQIDPSTLSKSPLVKIVNSAEKNQIDPSTYSKSPSVENEHLVEAAKTKSSLLLKTTNFNKNSTKNKKSKQGKK